MFFFFQAEDGIRDIGVTGVQTCALPICWDNPREFNPHRHLDANGNVNIKQDNFVAFSAGRRMCAGDTLAKTELFLFLAIILHQYSLVKAEGEPLPDMEGVRAINHYPKPFKICAIKR